MKFSFTKKLPYFLYLTAIFQISTFFAGKDLYPFSKNEMYAGHPSPINFEVIYIIGLAQNRELLNPSEFQEDVLTDLIEEELRKSTIDFNKVCKLMSEDMHRKNPVPAIRIEKRSWNNLTKFNVTKPDSIQVLHECKYN